MSEDLRRIDDERYIQLREDIAVIKTKVEGLHRIMVENGFADQINNHEVEIRELKTVQKMALKIAGIIATVISVIIAGIGLLFKNNGIK